MAYVEFALRHRPHFKVMWEGGIAKDNYPEVQKTAYEAYLLLEQAALELVPGAQAARGRALVCAAWSVVHVLCQPGARRRTGRDWAGAKRQKAVTAIAPSHAGPNSQPRLKAYKKTSRIMGIAGAQRIERSKVGSHGRLPAGIDRISFDPSPHLLEVLDLHHENEQLIAAEDRVFGDTGTFE